MDQGEFAEVGPPEQVIDAPNDPRTKEFLSRFRTLGAKKEPCQRAARPGRPPIFSWRVVAFGAAGRPSSRENRAPAGT